MESLSEEKLMKDLNEALKGSESPCTDCLESARNAYVSCDARAKTPEEKSACLASLNAAIASCNAGPCRKP